MRTHWHRLLRGRCPSLADYVRGPHATREARQSANVAHPLLRELKKLSVEVIREQSEKTPMARKVHASFTRFQSVVNSGDQVADGADGQLAAG